jgi:predicted NACHT family NTPase
MVSQPVINAGALTGGPTYHWQRFWIARTGTVDLSDSGFLADPTNPLLRFNDTKPMPLDELTDYRALVLLGEPGIGKSTTLLEEAHRRVQQAHGEDTTSIHIDLRAYSSESLLHKKLFESAEFLTWAQGTSQLVLHLDSLDEALLRIDSIAALLADELPRYPASRMSLRIACRTAVWPAGTLETALLRLWGESSVGVFELAPLRRRDVVAAAEVRGIDYEAFIQELFLANAVPFAIKPLTLNLLLGLFKKEGRLPRSVADLYFRGCLKLCEESSWSRRDARRLGTLTAEQRLRLASRVAATTMFANRYAVWTGQEADGVPEEDVPLSAFAGGREEGSFPAFNPTEEGVREVLDTGLFTSRGGIRMGWAHQSYAEFLVALYLIALANI